jgi:hypothetical protein
MLDRLAATDQGTGSVQGCPVGGNSGVARDGASGGGASPYQQLQHRPPNDECFQLKDYRTGQVLPRARYRLEWPGGTVEGTSDENGFTQRISTEYRVEQITVTYFPPDQELAQDNDHPGGCD